MTHNTPWKKRVFIIAEAGVNHNGEVRLAKKLIDAAKASKVDAVKFQTWKPGEITGRFAFKVGYLKKTTAESESRYELSRRLALSYDAFRELHRYARKAGILFLSTPDGFDSLDFLSDELHLPYIKIGSTEVTHVQFLEAVGRKNKPVILSTGMSTLDEIALAIKALHRHTKPPIALLQCTSAYPVRDEEVNLKAMVTIAKKFKLPVGFSDHSLGLEASIAAIGMGACIIEKHFTLDKKLSGPDHQASLDLSELTQLVTALRRTENMMGDGIKHMTATEMKNWKGIRRGVVAAIAIKKDQVLTHEMLICKRPATGVKPSELSELVGMKACKDLEVDEPISWKHVR